MQHRLIIPSAPRTVAAAAIALLAAVTIITPSVVDAGCPVGQVQWGPQGTACYSPAFSLGAARGAYFYNSNIPLMIATGQTVAGPPAACSTTTLINFHVATTVPTATAAVTTAAPTTAALSITATPTVAPTTTVPSTAAAITVTLTTSPATTLLPTTPSPTTSTPTTSPTTTVPSTAAATTVALTTSPATTLPPTTPTLTTAPSTTAPPTTVPPTTAAATTAPATTVPPTTVPPTTAGVFQPYHRVHDFGITIGPGAATGYQFTLAPDNVTYWQMLQKDATGYGTVATFNNKGAAYTESTFQAYASNASIADHTAAKWPIGSLLLHTNGLFYGLLTSGSQTYVSPHSAGVGSFFSVVPATSVFTFIQDFSSALGTVHSPSSGLLQSNINGTQMMYGITGSGCEQVNSLGVKNTSYAGGIFSINTNGNSTCLYSFFSNTDGTGPNGAMTQDAAGVLYGTMSNGIYATGICSTVYSYNIGSKIFKRLHVFTTAANDCLVMASVTLVIDSSNVQWLYGMSSQNGVNVDAGSIYRMQAATGASYSVLHAFNDPTDGVKPYGTLTLATNGVLYGTTSQSGPGFCGVIFSYAPATNIYKNLYIFNNTGDSTDTCISLTQLLQGPGGYLMGSGTYGGINDDGTIFSYQILDY